MMNRLTCSGRERGRYLNDMGGSDLLRQTGSEEHGLGRRTAEHLSVLNCSLFLPLIAQCCSLLAHFG